MVRRQWEADKKADSEGAAAFTTTLRTRDQMEIRDGQACEESGAVSELVS